MAHNSRRRKRRLGKLAFESLEPRIVLDAQLGAALAGDLGIPAATEVGEVPPAAVSEASGTLERFSSADELTQFLVRDADLRYAELFGREAWSWWGGPYVTAAFDQLAVTDATPEQRTDYSTTNIQVAGVDEGDLVKTDGRYLYIGHGPEVTIVDVQSAADMRILARLDNEGALAALYLSDNRLTVISHQFALYGDPLLMADAAMGYRPSAGESKFQVTVYDVSAPETPQMVSRLEIEGNYVDSRMIGETVYLVSSHPFYLPSPEIVPGRVVPDKQESLELLGGDALPADLAARILPWPGPNPDGSGWVYETREQYWARIGDQVLDFALPNYALRDAAGNPVHTGLLSSAVATYRPLNGQGEELVSITAFDVGAAEPAVVASSSAPLGWANTVYVSPHNLYLVSTTWAEAGESSGLFKFALRPEQGEIPLVAAGRVPGRVLNSFSLDEQDDKLRIVTQRGWRAAAQSDLFVLEQVGGKLAPIGQVERLAPGEELYSVRFLGDRAFVVTFGPDSGVWIDPLFTIDLSDPAAPRVEGELEIPGFSNYLQLIDGQFLLGLGRNADEFNGRQLEPQVSLFDVADFANPSLTDRVSFGDVNSWSEAFFNHHAISYFPEQQILAVPLETWYPYSLSILRTGSEAAGESVLPAWLSQLWVFRVDTAAETPQLRVLGTIPHDSTILRSLRIGEQLFSISTDTIQVHDIFDPGEKLGEVYFGPRAIDDWFTVQRMTELAQRDLAARLSVPVEEIGVGASEAVDWPDSCLGVPAPNQMCLMVITPGYRISLLHGSTTYVYHTDTTDTVILAKQDTGSQTGTDPEPSDPLIHVRLEATDANGQVITTIRAGETLTLNLYVDDLRDSGAGVYATYADIFYPARLVTVVEESIAYDEAYANGRAGDVDRPGLVNELGAFAGLRTLGSDERLLASVSFVARREGTAAFTLTPADVRGHETLVYGLDQVVSADAVDWQGVEVQVLGGWHNTEIPPDVNDDGRVTPQDALHGINAINAHGKQLLERAELQAGAGAAAAADRFFFDVDGDDYLSPGDVLLVVNRLNAGDETTVTVSGDDGLPARPLASWVDWKSLRELLQQDRWQQPLQTLQLSAERTLGLVHKFLVSVDADRLNDWLQNQEPFDPAEWKSTLAPVLGTLREHVSVDELLDLADQLQANFDDLDLQSILPGLAPQISLTSVREVFHDACFARLSNPLFLLDLLDT